MRYPLTDYGRAEAAFNEGQEAEGWYHLFLFQEQFHYPLKRGWRESSPRQKEAQRLWQQRGLLERAKANLHLVLRDPTLAVVAEYPSISQTLSLLSRLILENSLAMDTIRSRIPK